jgi:hypothetical protein
VAQASEVATLRHLSRDPAIPAPGLVAEGGDPVPFLVTRRMHALARADAPPRPDAALRIACAIGLVLARAQARGSGALPRAADLPQVPLRQALAATALPAHLHAPLVQLAADLRPAARPSFTPTLWSGTC